MCSSDLIAKGLTSVGVGASGVRSTPLTLTERVEKGDYDSMNPDDQLKAIPAVSWKYIKDSEKVSPEIKNAIKDYSSFYEWRQATEKELTKEIQKSYPDAKIYEANDYAKQLIDNSEIAKAYNNVNNAFETIWIQDNPKLADQILSSEVDMPVFRRRIKSMTKQEGRVLRSALAQ